VLWKIHRSTFSGLGNYKDLFPTSLFPGASVWIADNQDSGGGERPRLPRVLGLEPDLKPKIGEAIEIW